MAKNWLFSLFSQREKERKGELPDVYSYDQLPDNLRVQCVQIMQECAEQLFVEDDGIFELVKILRKDRGVFSLGPRGANHTDNRGRYRAALEFYNSFLSEAKIEEALDYLEVFFGVISESYDHHTASCESEINQMLSPSWCRVSVGKSPDFAH